MSSAPGCFDHDGCRGSLECIESDRLWDEAMRDLAERGVDTHEAMRRACAVLDAAERGELEPELPIDNVIVLAMPFPFLIVQYQCDARFPGDDRYLPRFVFVRRDTIGRVVMAEEWLTIINPQARA
jgi:hypothetical protein